jgi:2-polyprenyl-6-hydroxyphenyl methylase/3-demethylubiquinone-9 3-methyltransferase
MVAAAERETIQSSQDIRFNVIESVEKLDFGDQSFDGILCSSVVEYVSEPDLVFSEFSRILKPNGCLILSVPNKLSAMRGIQHFSRHIMSKFGIDIFGYLTVSVNDFSKNEINRRLELFNMCSTEVRPFDPIFSLFGCSTKLDALLVVVAKKRG